MSPCSRAKRTAFILLLTHPFVVEAAAPAGTCVADDETRCLGDSRFAVEMDWRTGDDAGLPDSGHGHGGWNLP